MAVERLCPVVFHLQAYNGGKPRATPLQQGKGSSQLSVLRWRVLLCRPGQQQCEACHLVGLLLCEMNTESGLRQQNTTHTPRKRNGKPCELACLVVCSCEHDCSRYDVNDRIIKPKTWSVFHILNAAHQKSFSELGPARPIDYFVSHVSLLPWWLSGSKLCRG